MTDWIKDDGFQRGWRPHEAEVPWSADAEFEDAAYRLIKCIAKLRESIEEGPLYIDDIDGFLMGIGVMVGLEETSLVYLPQGLWDACDEFHRALILEAFREQADEDGQEETFGSELSPYHIRKISYIVGTFKLRIAAAITPLLEESWIVQPLEFIEQLEEFTRLLGEPDAS